MNAEVEDSREPLLMESVKYLMPWVGSQHKNLKSKMSLNYFSRLTFLLCVLHSTQPLYAMLEIIVFAQREKAIHAFSLSGLLHN